MNHSLSTLKSLYNLDEKELSSFICMLCTLNEGESFSSRIAKITKISNNQFELSITPKSIETLVKELTHDEDISAAFN